MTSPIRLRPAPPHEPPYIDEPARSIPAPRAADVQPPMPAEQIDSSALAPLEASVECHQAARRFVMLVVEICHGFRAAGQLAKVARPREAQLIIDEIAKLAREVARRKPSQVTRLDAIKPRRIRVCEPRPGVAEAAVVLSVHGTVIAVAFRLERVKVGGAWLATAAVVL